MEPELAESTRGSPSKQISAEEVRVRLGRLITSFVKLAAAMALLYLLGRILADYDASLFGFRIQGFQIVGILRFAAVVYFGYHALSELLWLLDLSARRLSQALGLEEVGGVRRIGQDLIYLMGLALAWYGLSPLISAIPSERIRLIPSLAFLALGVLLAYDMAKSIYRLFSEKFEAFLDRLTALLTRGLAESEREPDEEVNVGQSQMQEG